jgi:DNA-binding SARP family transcriptional activator
VHALRSNLEPGRARHGGSTFIVARNGGYYLDRDRVWVDADEFEQRAATGLSAAGSGDGQAALSALTAALELYTGDFLGDEPYAEWAFAERDRHRDLAGQVMRTTSEIYRASGELDAAMSQLQRLAAADPYDVDVQRQLIGLYLIAGRRSQAVRRYQRLHHQMLTEFGEKLDFELSDLSAEALAQDRPSRRHQSRP